MKNARLILATLTLTIGGLIASSADLYAQTDVHTREVRAKRVLLLDRDADGLPDRLERIIGTNPQSADTDNDGITDDLEIVRGSTMTYAEAFSKGLFDLDGDGITDRNEAKHGFSPFLFDTKGNGIADGSLLDDQIAAGNSGYKLPVTLESKKSKAQKKKCKRGYKLVKGKCKKKKKVTPTPSPSGTLPPDITPGPTATPTKTPTPKPTSVGCWTGNTTQCFGIGSAGQTGDRSQGQALHSANNCSGSCHGEKNGANYSAVRIGSAYSGKVFSSSDVADLTAYLNRNSP